MRVGAYVQVSQYARGNAAKGISNKEAFTVKGAAKSLVTLLQPDGTSNHATSDGATGAGFTLTRAIGVKSLDATSSTDEIGRAHV